MIILRVACDNSYMFKDFEVDFTYERKSNHYLSENDRLFTGSNIKVRKNLIVMGGNVSGKTTFGKLLCMILNFIYGKDLNDGSFSMASARYDKSKDSSFEIEFVIDDVAYLLKANFHNGSLHKEEVFRQKIYKSYNVKTLRKKLYESKAIETYYAVENLLDIGYKSYAFALSTKLGDLRKKIGFWFSFSELPLNSSTYLGETNIKFLNDVLPKIDNSVASVKRLTVEGETGESFSKKTLDSQVFFTTHNAELLDLNVPITSFLLFKRNEKGFNEVIYPSEVLRRNIRSLRMNYENDYFGVLPDYSVLDKFFEEKSND